MGQTPQPLSPRPLTLQEHSAQQQQQKAARQQRQQEADGVRQRQQEPEGSQQGPSMPPPPPAPAPPDAVFADAVPRLAAQPQQLGPEAHSAAAMPSGLATNWQLYSRSRQQEASSAEAGSPLAASASVLPGGSGPPFSNIVATQSLPALSVQHRAAAADARAAGAALAPPIAPPLSPGNSLPLSTTGPEDSELLLGSPPTVGTVDRDISLASPPQVSLCSVCAGAGWVLRQLASKQDVLTPA